MKKIKNIFNLKRVLCLAFAVVMTVGVFTAVFLENGVTAKAAISVGDYSMAFFNVPETIYLTPGATTFEYVCDQTMDDNGGISITTEAKLVSAGANVNFYCPTATNVRISVSPSVTLGKNSVSSGNRLDTTFTSGSVSSNSSQVITWTATYNDSTDGETKTAYAYTYVYAPFTGTVAGESFARRKQSNNDACIANSTVWITGIHSITGLTHGQNSYDDFGGVITNNPLFGGTAARTSTPRNDTIDSGNAYSKGVMVRGSSTGEGWSAHWSANGDSAPYEDRHTALYEAWITVDKSRFTRFNNIPNLECGLDIHEAWTPNGKTNRSLGISTDGSNKTNLIARAASDQNSEYYNGKRERSAVDYFIPESSGALIIAGNTMARIANSYPSAYLNYTITNKSSLRSTINYAQNAGFEYTDEYKDALEDAYTVLGRPDADASAISSAYSKLQGEVDKFESGDSAVYFNVPEVIYLTPGAATYQYVCDQTMDASGNITVNQGYKAISSGGNINFYCPGASSATVSSSYGTAPSDTNSAADRYDGKITSGSWSSSTTSGYITWTATYIKNGETYTKTAYTHVYAPYLNAVAAISNGNSRETGYSETATWTALWGIHDVLTSYSDSLNLDGDYNHGSDIDATIVYKYKLNEHSTTPSNYYGGSAPSALYSSVDGTKSSTSKSGGAYFYKNSGNAASSDVAGGTGVIYIDPTRVKKIGDIPNFYVHSYLGSFKTDGSENYTIDCSNWAKYYVIGSDGAIKNSSKYDTGSVKNFSSLTKVADPSLSSLAISSGYKFYNVSFRTWRKRNAVGSKDEMRRADAVVGCVFEGNNKSELRDLVEESISVNTDAFSPDAAAAFNSAYETAAKTLAQADATSSAVSNAYDALVAAKAGKTRSHAYGEYYNTINNSHDTSILSDISRAFTLGDKITATAEDVSGYVYRKMEFPFDVGSFYLRSSERTGPNVASVSVNSANNSITVTSGASGTDNYTTMPSGGGDSRHLYYLEVQPGAEIKLSADISGSSSQMFIFCLDANGKWNNDMASTGATGHQEISKVISSGTKYVCFRFGNKSPNTTTTFSNITLTYTGDSIYLTRVQKQNITFKFFYEPKPYTIYLDGNGATTMGTAEVECKMGAILPSITVPTRTGYTFQGYWDDPAGGTQYYDEYGVGSRWVKAGNGTLYAHWLANQYTVNLNGEGATSTGYTTFFTVKYDSAYPNIVVPAKTGYTFVGYYTDEVAGDKIYNADGTPAVSSCTLLSNATFYARWTVKTWTIDIDAVLDGTESETIAGFGTMDVIINGNSVAQGVSEYKTKHAYNSTYEISNITEVVGHTYEGFIDAAGVRHDVDDAITGTIPAEADCTIKLIFRTNTYTVRFNANGGTNVSGSMADVVFKYGESMALPANAFSTSFIVSLDYNYEPGETEYKNGPDSRTVPCSFAGWSLTPGGEKVYENSQSVSNLTSEDDRIVDLYAVWNSGSAILTKPARLGYTFGGWYTDEDFTVRADEFYMPSGDITLQAKWNRVQFGNVVKAYDFETGVKTKIIDDNDSFPAGGQLSLGTGLGTKPLNQSTIYSNLSGNSGYITKNGYIIEIKGGSGKDTEISFKKNEYAQTTSDTASVYYEYRFTENGLTQYITGTLTFVPANNVYYEEYYFKTQNSVIPQTSDEFSTPADWSTLWVMRNTLKQTGTEYPVYGYSINAKADVYNGFSNGRVLRTTVTANSPMSKSAEFEFTGKGFDLYSACGENTSVLMVYVWSVVDKANGTKEYYPVANAAVDTFMNDGDLLTLDYNGKALLRQVPVYHFEATNENNPDINLGVSAESGKYLVQVYALWIDEDGIPEGSGTTKTRVIEKIEDMGLEVNDELFEMEWADENSVLNGGSGAASGHKLLGARAASCFGYIDGIRVYNRCGAAGSEYANGYDSAYVSNEKDAYFYNIKQFTRGSTVNEYKPANINENSGDPINEVYLAPFDGPARSGATAFKLTGFDPSVNRVMISARAVTGEPALIVRGEGPGAPQTKIKLVSGTEMYFDVTDYISFDENGDATVCIQQADENSANGYAAVCNVKITEREFVPAMLRMARVTSLTASEASSALNFINTVTPDNLVDYKANGASRIVNMGDAIVDIPEVIDEPGTEPGDEPGTGSAPSIRIDITEALKPGYKKDTEITCTVKDAPAGSYIKWYINDEYVGTGNSMVIKKIRAEAEVSAELVASNGNTLCKSAAEKVTPKLNIFQMIIEFIVKLFSKPKFTVFFK